MSQPERKQYNLMAIVWPWLWFAVACVMFGSSIGLGIKAYHYFATTC